MDEKPNVRPAVTTTMATLISMLVSVAAWSAASTNYKLGYAATDGGGGTADSTGYDLQASAIGKSIATGMGMSTVYSANVGTPMLDDDGDGLDNGVEQLVFSTNPNNADTDNDLLNDGEEVITFLTDPILFDTDGDTLGDGEEVANGWNPLDALDPFGAIENVPLPVWATLLLGLILMRIIKHRKRAY